MCVFRRRIAPLPRKHPYGSLPLAILLLPLRARCDLVAISSFIALSFPCFLAVLILMAGSCAVIFLSKMFALAWYVYMHPIVILLGTIFWMIFLVTLISLRRLLPVVISIQCLIGLLTVMGLLFFIPPTRARGHSLPSLFLVASLISGVTFILNASSLRGLNRMGLCTPGSIISAALTLGFPQSHLVISCLVRFRTTALSLCPDSFLLPFLGVPAFGN